MVCSIQSQTHHFQGPYPPNPDLDLPLDAIHVLKIDALPPAPARWLPPEQEKLLGHPYGVAIGDVPLDIGTELGQGETAYHRLARF